MPIQANSEHQQKVSIELRNLRNKSVFGFFIIDILLITLVISVQSMISSTPSMGIKWNCTDPVSGVVSMITFEPISFVFIIIFGALLLIQFACLIMHQSFSFLQIVSSVKLSFRS